MGCLLSHAEVARRAIKDGLSNYLVFEDDAILDPKFDQLFDEFVRNVPKTWDQIYLGGEHLRVPEDMGNGIFKGYDINRGHAYALSRKTFPDSTVWSWTIPIMGEISISNGTTIWE